MQVNLKQPGQPVADFSIIGNFVTVSGITVDCAQRQCDITQVIEIRQNPHGPSEGGNGAYLAQISIPPRRQDTDSDNSFDANTVCITLWPKT